MKLLALTAVVGAVGYGAVERNPSCPRGERGPPGPPGKVVVVPAPAPVAPVFPARPVEAPEVKTEIKSRAESHTKKDGTVVTETEGESLSGPP